MRTQNLLGLALTLVVAAAATTAGCNKDPKALFVDMRWRAICGSGGNCVNSSPSREILGQDEHVNSGDPDGEEIDARCAAVPGADDTTVLIDLAGLHTDYGIFIDNVLVPEDGGANLSPACMVHVEESINISGDLLLQGSCSPDAADNAPCTVSAEITRVDGDPTAIFTVSCTAIPTEFDPGTYRNIVQGGSVTPLAAAELEVRNCPGL